MANAVMNQAKERMDNAIGAYTRELAAIRAGRANASLLDRITVDYYGHQRLLIKWRGFQFLKHAS